MNVAEKHNFYRLSLLILDAGTPVLRWLFENQYSATCNLQALMSSKKQVVNDLCRLKIISQNQKDLLLPNTGCGPSLDDLDISLLATLLTNLFSIRPPTFGWGTEPAATDTSIGADILRLRNARNKLYAHRVNSKINDCEFQQAWSNISGCISRLSSQLDQQHQEDIQNKICNAQEAHIDYAREKEIDSMIFTTEINTISEKLEKLNGIISHQELLDRGLTSVRIVISEDQSEEDSKLTPTDDTGIENLTGTHPPSNLQKLGDDQREQDCKYDQGKKLRNYQKNWANEYAWLEYERGKAVMWCTFGADYCDKYDSVRGGSFVDGSKNCHTSSQE